MTPTASGIQPAGWARTAGGYAFVLALCFAVYWPALSGAFLWDDPAHITFLHLRSWGGLLRIWTEPGVTQQYYPLLHSAFWVEHRLWGDAPLGYHLVNVFLHATSACLLVLVLRRLLPATEGRTFGVPELAGLLFALHPVAVESVAWISEQKNTLSLVFYLAAGLAYLRYDAERGRGFYRLALLGYLLALLTKSVTASLPAALLVVVWFRRGRLSWREDVRPLLPWFALGLSFGLFTAWLEHDVIGAQGTAFGLSATERLLLAGRVLCFYLGKTLWPADLMFVYPRWNVPAEARWWWPCLAGVLALTVLLWLVRKRSRGPLAAWLLFAGSLFPALGFVNVFPFQFSYVADHFQYLALLGPVTLVAAVLAWAGSRLPVPVRGAVGLLLAGGLGLLVWQQSRIYTDKTTLWRANWERNPDSWIVCNDLGQALLDSGRAEESLFFFRQAQGVAPDDVAAAVNLAVAFETAGHPRDAVAQYLRVLERHPEQPLVLGNLGVAFARLGYLEDAVRCYLEALRLGGDDDGSVRYNLGLALLAAGDPARALPCFEEAAKRRPASSPAWNMQGVALMGLGRPSEAVVRYEEAIRRAPGDFEPLNNLGVALLKLGRFPEAVPVFERAAAARPEAPELRQNLAIAFARTGRLADAAATFRASLKLRSDDTETHYKLGVVLAQDGKPEEALAELGEALRLQPDNASAHLTMADVLAASGREAEAALHREAARRLQAQPAGAAGAGR